jgi:hypothetical protein
MPRQKALRRAPAGQKKAARQNPWLGLFLSFDGIRSYREDVPKEERKKEKMIKEMKTKQ